MHKIYEAFVCTKERKVVHAAFYLSGFAQDWWELRRQVYDDVHAIVWQDFRADFCEHFMPETYRNKKMAEFFGFQQGPRTVEQYERQFRALSRHVPGVVINDEMLRSRFLEGLDPEIYVAVAGSKWMAYKELVEAAIWSERGVQKKRAATRQQGRSWILTAVQSGSRVAHLEQEAVVRVDCLVLAEVRDNGMAEVVTVEALLRDRDLD